MPDTRRTLSALQTLLADNTAGDISAQDARDELISSHPEKISQSDTQANEPSSGQLTGDLFFPTNGVQIERYSGSAWLPWGPLFPFTKPVDGDFSWVNQGSATVSTTNGGIVLVAPSNAGSQNLRIRKKSAPATPYTITAAFMFHMDPAISTGGYGALGLCFRQSSDGKLSSHHLITHTDTGTWPNEALNRGTAKWTDASTLSAYYNRARGLPPLCPVFWSRIQDDGTNRIISESSNGRTWTAIHTVGRTDFLTADEIGFYVNPYSLETSMTLLSWKQE